MAKNLNKFDQTRFRISIDKLPNTNLFIQRAILPGISISKLQQSTPLSDIPTAGDEIIFENFSVTFKVDENLANWWEIYDWMLGLGHVDDFEDRKKLIAKTDIYGKTGLFSNCLLTLLNSDFVPYKQACFDDIFPIALSSIELDSKSQNSQKVDCIVDFAYRRFYLKDV